MASLLLLLFILRAEAPAFYDERRDLSTRAHLARDWLVNQARLGISAMEERDEARAERDEARAERDEARAELEDIFYAPLTEAEAAPPSPESSSESVGSERLQGFFEGVASMQPELARVKALASQAQNRIRALTIALEQTRGSRAPAREEQIEEVLSILRPFSDLSDRLVTLRDGLQGLQTYVADMDQDLSLIHI